MSDVENIGIRPVFADGGNGGAIDTHPYCPGNSLTDPYKHEPAVNQELGRILAIWEGHATDHRLRYEASSGGLLSALSLYCLEQEGMRFVLHTAMDSEYPYRNKTVVSASRDDIIRRCGSRYAPSSPCEGLEYIEKADGLCVFIGKPCDVAAVSELRKIRPQLDRNLGLVLTFFCAGTPSTEGTLQLIEYLQGSPDGLEHLRYRGNGWPGSFTGSYRNTDRALSLNYEDSWNFLTAFRPLRCNLCPDGLGRFGDLSCGDAWHRYTNDGNAGLSVVLARTTIGNDLLHRAIKAGYISIDQIPASTLLRSQKNLLKRRRDLYGRLQVLRLVGIPKPEFPGFYLQGAWKTMKSAQKAKILLGTLKRVLKYGWWKRTPLLPESPHF